MGKIGIASFTKRGRMLSERIEEELCREYEVVRREGSLQDWCRECFDSAEGIIFIGACGIAVRTIAPFLKSKTQDPAVVVIDEAGNFVISLLSGHIGGANEFAVKVAQWIGAVPVITTASDVNGKIAVDVFAKKNHLTIGSMRDAREIAAAILRGQRVGVLCTGQIQGEVPPELTLVPEAFSREAAGGNELFSEPGKGLPGEPERMSGELSERVFGAGRELTVGVDQDGGSPVEEEERVDHLIWISEYLPDKARTDRCLRDSRGTVLHLIPKNVVLGVGCRRGKPEEEIRSVVEKVWNRAGISPRAVCAAASIDLKQEEQGILALCEKYDIPFFTYSAEELARVKGEFKPSDFVKKTTGVDNVCERAALLAAGSQFPPEPEEELQPSKPSPGECLSRAPAPAGGREPDVSHGNGARFICRKYAENGVTAALAAREWRVCFEK